MIEFIAEGPITRTTNEKRIRREDGHDEIHGRAFVMQDEEIRIDIEFPQGHVNLEGHAPSSAGGWTVGELVLRHLEPEGEIEIMPPQKDEWYVALHGEWFDWIQQAHRYVTERPGKSLVDCLHTFGTWDEVDKDAIILAIEKAKAASELSDVELREMDGIDFELLREELNDLEEVRIPESYTD